VALEGPLGRRLTFDDFWGGPLTMQGFEELAGRVPPGLGQVFVSHPEGKRDAQVPIDWLAEDSSVDSVVAASEVTTARPLPAIRELLFWTLDAWLTPPTIANLPNLERLVVNQFDFDSLARLPKLVDLSFSGRHAERLPELPRLQRLRVRGEVFDASADLLMGMTELRWLQLHGWGNVRRLNALTNLERLEVSGSTMANLRSWRNLKGLRHLRLGGQIGSLDGIEAFVDLETLALGISDGIDLSPLTALPRLRSLTLRCDDAPSSLPAIGSLKGLRRFEIELGDFRRFGRLPSIEFLGRLVELEHVTIRTVDLEDHRLDPLFDLPSLRTFDLFAAAGPNLEEFERRRPGLDGRRKLMNPPEGRFSVGEVMIDHPPGTDRWSIYQDLTRLLRTETNADADARLRAALQRTDAGLLGRLTWDSESGGVAVYAGTEGDIRAVARVILDLAPRA
jgi:hypothetical protein